MVNPFHWVVEFTLLRKRLRVEMRGVERVSQEPLVIHADGSFTAKGRRCVRYTMGALKSA
jgi:hypothetical protein